MSGPREQPFIEHTPPRPFPFTALVGVAVPMDLHRVIEAAAKKNGIDYDDQLLMWAQKGAECFRLHSPKERLGRKNRK